MCHWFLLLSYVLVFVVAKSSEKGECGSKCTGTEYECFEGHCYCAAGYIQNYFQTGCVKCPDLGDKCFGTCCNTLSNSSLQCWHGVCQPCYDSSLNWICRDTVDQILLVSTTQVVMGMALVLGIVATLVLLMKLCAKTSLRPLGSNLDSRLSIGSLQTYVDERLRDAPPRYSGATTANTTVPVLAYQNECFIPDSSIPPPPYSEVIKTENNQNIAVHI